MRSNRSNRGFTLVETLVTTAILVTGLVAVASLFSWSVATNLTNQQRTAATSLMADKMEQFRAVSLSDAMWTAGGSLNVASPSSGYWDYVTVASDGTITSDTSSTTAPYIRIWAVSGTTPRTVTIIVYAQKAGLTRTRTEMIRATTMAINSF